MPDLPTLPTLPALTRFPMLPAFPNPIDQLGQGLGASMAALAASAFDQAMKSLWDFALALLGSVLGVIDHLTTPNLDPRTGPLASVLPATIWVGAVLLVVLSLVQVAKAALTGGAGLGHLFTGIAQYMIISASALSLLVVLVTAANAAALGILASGLHTSTWQGIATSNTAWQNGVAGVSGAGLGLIALLGVLPAAIGLLVAALVREASILVIAATIPILAAGLVAQVSARWFWTGLRWLFALIMLTPAVAIVLSIGLQLAVGAANATGTSSSEPGQQAVTALVGAAVLLISLFCPLALFKLFAFIDPGTASGQRLRTSLAGNGAGPAPAGRASQSPAGQSSSSQSTPGAGSPGSGDDASEQIDSRWASAVGKLSAPHRAMASGTPAAMSSAAAVLSAVGVGAGADPDHATGRQQPKPAMLAPSAELAAYRVAQDGLTNVLKHSTARQGWLRLLVRGGSLVVDVTDSGPARESEQALDGHGLIGMRERVRACGGDLEAGPALDGGFRVTARLPLGVGG